MRRQIWVVCRACAGQLSVRRQLSDVFVDNIEDYIQPGQRVEARSITCQRGGMRGTGDVGRLWSSRDQETAWIGGGEHKAAAQGQWRIQQAEPIHPETQGSEEVHRLFDSKCWAFLQSLDKASMPLVCNAVSWQLQHVEQRCSPYHVVKLSSLSTSTQHALCRNLRHHHHHSW